MQSMCGVDYYFYIFGDVQKLSIVWFLEISTRVMVVSEC